MQTLNEKYNKIILEIDDKTNIIDNLKIDLKKLERTNEEKEKSINNYIDKENILNKNKRNK